MIHNMCSAGSRLLTPSALILLLRIAAATAAAAAALTFVYFHVGGVPLTAKCAICDQINNLRALIR